MHINTYKNQLHNCCEYASIVMKLADNKLFPTVSTNMYIQYASLYWFLSKFIEDELVSLKDYARISGVPSKEIIKHEKDLFNYYLSNQKDLNELIFAASGTLGAPDPDPATNILGGVGGPETLRNDPPGVSSPV